MTLASSLSDNDGFVRELHHRVKNNFQVIASLVSLRKRSLPPDRRDEVRFVEETLQGVAAAYRLVTVTDRAARVALGDMVADVVDALRRIAGIGRDSVSVELPVNDCLIPIDQAITMGLYLAALLPPYLDAAMAIDSTLRVAIVLDDPEYAALSIVTAQRATLPRDPLRQRLVAAYRRQLSAEVDPTTEPGAVRVRIRLLPLQAANVGDLGPATV
jgi:Histidine kinase